MAFTLPDLPYAHDALAPYMSRETLEYHHDKHHLAYVNNGNNLLKAKIDSELGGVAKMKEDFAQAGVTQFGSGWCWIAVKDGKLAITKTANGENPLVHGAKPILGCDVWEHSYYIDYRNRRPDYLKAFLDHLVNWDYVAEMYAAATK
jgi:Fe-Mn family superoxide dismutase